MRSRLSNKTEREREREREEERKGLKAVEFIPSQERGERGEREREERSTFVMTTQCDVGRTKCRFLHLSLSKKRKTKKAFSRIYVQQTRGLLFTARSPEKKKFPGNLFVGGVTGRGLSPVDCMCMRRQEESRSTSFWYHKSFRFPSMVIFESTLILVPLQKKTRGKVLTFGLELAKAKKSHP